MNEDKFLNEPPKDWSLLVVSIGSGRPYDVEVTRPGPWGNPFSHLPRSSAIYRVATAEEAVARFRDWLKGQPELVMLAQVHLRGKRLGCVCLFGQPCHAYVWAEVANA